MLFRNATASTSISASQRIFLAKNCVKKLNDSLFVIRVE